MDALTAIQNISEMNEMAMAFRILKNSNCRLDGLHGFIQHQQPQQVYSEDFEESTSCSIPPGYPVTAKLVDFRGHKVAAFDVGNKEMICLPQVYELFLKNMVGGLHTVYTKLRRLDINPMICNVEQVRALRSLGAIQPGVNRCKLIESGDFDKLYEDCTSICTRPGRPSKRGGYDDWVAGVVKKEKMEEVSSQQEGPSSFSSSCTSSSASSTSQSTVFNQLLPQFTTQQLIMQHFVAMQQQQQQQHQQQQQNDRPTSCSSSSQPASNGGTPLNLSKSNENGSGSGSSGNSMDNNDSDSLENMRKEDSSPNNSERAGSNSNSLSVEGSSNSGRGSSNNSMGDAALMNKVMSLIEITSEQFKHERQELWRERNEIQLLRESFHKIVQEERELRMKLETQTRKCGSYERRFKYMQQQLGLARAEIQKGKRKSAENQEKSETVEKE